MSGRINVDAAHSGDTARLNPSTQEHRMSHPSIPRTALVTGGTRGIGEAIALALHEAAHRVVATCFAGAEDPATCREAQAAAGREFRAEPVDGAGHDSRPAI